MKTAIISLYSAIIILSGCSAMAPAPLVQQEKGDKVVCILFKDTRFKTEVVGILTGELSKKGYRVVTGSVAQARHYIADEYAAIVYMSELWAWHTPWHAKRYYREQDEAINIVFVVTSGDPDVSILKPFDAVTSASSPGKVGDVVGEVMTKLDRVLP